MTLTELHERIGWQLAGVLQWRDLCNCWHDWRHKDCPAITDNAADYRRRPDPEPEPLPAEIWVAPDSTLRGNVYLAFGDKAECVNEWSNAVRYVRADRVFRLTDLEYKSSSGDWLPCDGNGYKYRFCQ